MKALRVVALSKISSALARALPKVLRTYRLMTLGALLRRHQRLVYLCFGARITVA